MNKITPNLHEMAARHFVREKGRLPRDKAELAQWLMEFTQTMGDIAKRAQQAFADHLALCNTRTYVNKGTEGKL